MEFKDHLLLKDLVDRVLWPVYIKHCTDLQITPVKIPGVKKLPALLDKNFGDSEVTSNRPKPRKNQPTQKHTSK